MILCRTTRTKLPSRGPYGNAFAASVRQDLDLRRPLAKLIHKYPVPELRIYTFFDRPVGPHPIAMFEVNIFTPAQFGAFVPWLVINRGPLSALIHPNTVEGEDERNHTQRATWLGERIPLDLRLFKLSKEAEVKKETEPLASLAGSGEKRSQEERAAWLAQRIPSDLQGFRMMNEASGKRG